MDVAHSGLLHALLDLADRTAIERHPILGMSWEGHIVNQLGAAHQSRPDQRYFWATHGGAELDLLITLGTERIGFEIKRTTQPSSTTSLTSARQTLRRHPRPQPRTIARSMTDDTSAFIDGALANARYTQPCDSPLRMMQICIQRNSVPPSAARTYP